MTTTINEGIIKKIQGLLAIAKDEKNDEESQSAFILAQKLMMKHNIEMNQVESESETKEVSNDSVTVYKTLLWWERSLATIISENFRVKWYYEGKYVNNRRKNRITFLGFKHDIELAKEMYILAYDVLVHCAKEFVENFYQENAHLNRSRATTFDIKNSYMRGFLEGMGEKFEEQVAEMKQEYGLVVLMPVEVKEAYNDMFGDKKGMSYTRPKLSSVKAYTAGFNSGKNVDYTKSTLDGGY